jgi:hypothetical protein
VQAGRGAKRTARTQQLPPLHGAGHHGAKRQRVASRKLQDTQGEQQECHSEPRVSLSYGAAVADACAGAGGVLCSLCMREIALQEVEQACGTTLIVVPANILVQVGAALVLSNWQASAVGLFCSATMLCAAKDSAMASFHVWAPSPACGMLADIACCCMHACAVRSGLRSCSGTSFLAVYPSRSTQASRRQPRQQPRAAAAAGAAAQQPATCVAQRQPQQRMAKQQPVMRW